MSDPVLWIVAVLVVAAAAVVGYFMGRGNPDRQRVDTLEKQLAAQSEEMTRQQQDMEKYRHEVSEHFDRTAELFVDMAGSYRALYEHLSAGYDTLGAKPGQRVLPDRPGALLEDPAIVKEVAPTLDPLPKTSEAEGSQPAEPAADARSPEDSMTLESQEAPRTEDSEPPETTSAPSGDDRRRD
ncbi:MAG: ZapG family protein [Halothiobacillaceae bacterium]